MTQILQTGSYNGIEKYTFFLGQRNDDPRYSETLTVLRDEGIESYGLVWASPPLGYLPGDHVLYMCNGELTEGELGYMDDLPEDKIVVEDSKTKEDYIINKEDLIGMGYKDYIFMPAL